MKNVSRRIAVAVSLFILMAPAGCYKPEWRPYTSTGGDYSVSFPAAAKEEDSTLQTAAGPTTMHQAEATLGTTAYFVASNQFAAPSEVDAEKILDGARDGQLRKVNGTLTKEERTTLGGYPARILAAKTPQGLYIWCKVIWVKKQRLYQVLVVSPSESNQANAQTFIDSFRLLKD